MITKFKIFESLTDNFIDINKVIPDSNIRKDILDIFDIFKNNGYKLYLVGGSVRDVLLNKEPKDYDLVTDALPDDVLRILKDKYKILEIGKNFGINKVITEYGEYEIATFRKESDYTDSRHPDKVEFTDIYGDYSRRDLTINALFYDLENQKIIDLSGGVDDVKNKVIRTVGNPDDRYNEDKLRKLRTIRFCARFGSKLDPKIEKSLLNDNSLTGVSSERIREEFLNGIKSSLSTVYFLELLDKFNFFDYIFPDLNINKKFIEEKNHIILISYLLMNNDILKVKNILNKISYTFNEIKDITFLIKFKNLDINNVIELKKEEKKSNLSKDDILKFSEYLNMDVEFVETFLSFNLTVGGDKFKEIGYKDREIGEMIYKEELENFKRLVGLSD